MASSGNVIGSGALSRLQLSRSCLAYHGVLSSDRFTTRTSRRTPSTSWRYQSGKVSLSPLVKMMALGAVLISMFWANSGAM